MQDALGVLTAAEGDGRLTLAREELNDLDLVVLDVMLPGISGFHVMRWLCSEANIPILMLAGRGEEQDRTNGQPARRPGERIGGRVREYFNAEEGRIFRQGVVALPLFGVVLASGSPALSREADLSALT